MKMPSSNCSHSAREMQKPRRSSMLYHHQYNNMFIRRRRIRPLLLVFQAVLLVVVAFNTNAFQQHPLPSARRRRGSFLPAAKSPVDTGGSSGKDAKSNSGGSDNRSSSFMSPVIPASASVGDLLDYLGDGQTRRRAARRLLKQPEQLPSDGLVALVEATCRLGNINGVQKLLAMMRELENPAPDMVLYESLLKMANKRFLWDLSLALLHEAELDSIVPTAPMLCATLHSCLQADRPKEATALLKRFQKHGVKPAVPLLMALIRLLSEKGMIPALREMSTFMAALDIEGDATLYTTLISAFGRGGSYEDVIKSAQLVEGKGIADKGRIYSTAVASLLEGNLIPEALGLYQRALQDGAEISRRGYEVLVAGAAASTDPIQAVFFLNEMKARYAPATTGKEEQSISPKVYWRPIGACLRARLMQEAAHLVKDYYSTMEGTVKDPAPLNNLVKASCDSGKVEDRELVLQVYQDIIAKTGAAFVGNSFTAMVLIGSYRSNNDFDAVVGLHRAMVDAGVEVWLPAASNVMFAYAKLGRQKEELQVFQALAAVPSQANLLASAGTKGSATGSPVERRQFLWERILSRAMFLAAEHQDLDVARLILQLLQKHQGLKAGAKDYTNLIKTFSNGQQPENALQVLILMTKRKERPSTVHYNAAMHAFARAERMADAEAVFEEMKMRQIPLDATTYNMLISGFERQRQPERALELYEEMSRKGIQADSYVLNSLISVTADLRNRTLANSLLQRFRSLAGVPESDVMYGAFMHAMGKADVASRREVLTLLEDLKASGRKPNVIMYNEALYATYRLVREDLSMADRALQYFHEMVQGGVTPDALTYRRLFKCLKQACRFQEIVDISAPLPRDLLVTNDRLGILVIASCLRVKDKDDTAQERALDLLGDLVLKPNISYATYRWATFVYATRIEPPDMNAAETIIELVKERGFKPDRAFYGYLMRGFFSSQQIERCFEIYHELLPAFQGGDVAAVALLCHIDRGRLDRVSSLYQNMREQDDVASVDLMVKILERLIENQDWKLALEAVELMLDYDVSITRPQRRHIEALVHQNPKGQALEILEGLTMLPVIGSGGGNGSTEEDGRGGGPVYDDDED